MFKKKDLDLYNHDARRFLKIRNKFFREKFSENLNVYSLVWSKVKINIDQISFIESIIDRQNYLIRKSVKLSKQFHIIASNIDQTLIMASIKSPYTKLKFIDKCIAASFYYEIEPIILFNKIDLLNNNEKRKLDELISIYNNLNIETHTISIKENTNLKEISKILENRSTLLIGNSGIGKSSLINYLSNKSNQKTDILSLKTGRGKQTTTFSEIFKLKNNGTIIDSP